MVDYEGQKLSELIFYVVIIAFGSVGWIIGYFQQDFTIVFQAWLVGVVLSVIVRIDFTVYISMCCIVCSAERDCLSRKYAYTSFSRLALRSRLVVL
jgi:hypothetical protein